MSLDAILWALKHSPVADTTERLLLVCLAERANPDGCDAYPSRKTLTEAALCDKSTVTRKLARMERRGLIAEGDQRAAERIPEHVRPKVYDLLIPASYYSADQLERVNRERGQRGLPPITAEDRPDIAPAPERAPRKDKGVARPRPAEAAQASPVRRPAAPRAAAKRAQAAPPPPPPLPTPDPAAPVDTAATTVDQSEPVVPAPRGEEIPEQAVVAAYAQALGRPVTRTVSAALTAAARELVADGLPVWWLEDRAREMAARGWSDLRMHASRSKVPVTRPAASDGTPDWCGQCDDPYVRMLESGPDRELVHCPACSPIGIGRRVRQEAGAA